MTSRDNGAVKTVRSCGGSGNRGGWERVPVLYGEPLLGVRADEIAIDFWRGDSISILARELRRANDCADTIHVEEILRWYMARPKLLAKLLEGE